MGILKKISRRLSKQPRCTAVIVAAGSASRMQGVDKVLADLGGKPVLLHTLLAFQQCGAVDEIVVVTRKDLLGPVGSLCRASEISKVRNIVAGGVGSGGAGVRLRPRDPGGHPRRRAASGGAGAH